MRIKIYFAAMALMALSFPSVAANAQQSWPAMSRGQQLLSITYDQCINRAKFALTTEGFGGLSDGNGFVYGHKGINAAYIMCNAAPDNRFWVNMAIASDTESEDVPRIIRVRLQDLMEFGSNTPTNGPSNAIRASWSTNATAYRGQNTSVTFDCPGGGSAGTVWGIDEYTDDSSVCTAAVHKGLISFALGGRVTIEMRQGAQSYQGSVRFGVTSYKYGPWSGGFVFVK